MHKGRQITTSGVIALSGLNKEVVASFYEEVISRYLLISWVHDIRLMTTAKVASGYVGYLTRSRAKELKVERFLLLSLVKNPEMRSTEEVEYRCRTLLNPRNCTATNVTAADDGDSERQEDMTSKSLHHFHSVIPAGFPIIAQGWVVKDYGVVEDTVRLKERAAFEKERRHGGAGMPVSVDNDLIDVSEESAHRRHSLAGDLMRALLTEHVPRDSRIVLRRATPPWSLPLLGGVAPEEGERWRRHLQRTRRLEGATTTWWGGPAGRAVSLAVPVRFESPPAVEVACGAGGSVFRFGKVAVLCCSCYRRSSWYVDIAPQPARCSATSS
ncbi:hypothetical protein AAG570_012102 [Ranatra chinensis]|uniref:Uncharacterized protein n=1 Tax=Ranatra chinensis TaxID=642074 RepID=A0ABD0YHT6_9HEMI